MDGMKERPILFTWSMVRAILDGHKTQTRRVFKDPYKKAMCRIRENGTMAYPEFDNGRGEWVEVKCRFGDIGDRLWVRETWMDLLGTGCEHRNTPGGQLTRYAYGADTVPNSYGDICRKEFGLKWRPSIFMPREACRLVLDITSTRVERLQAITEVDAMAEGVEWKDRAGLAEYTARKLYRRLWEAINGKDSWDLNPWVWVVEFRRVLC